VRAIDRVALNIFNGVKFALGLNHLDRWMARRDAVANLQLALELQKHPALVDAGKKLEESAKRVLRD
jgi:hypothetical protein